MADDDWTEFSKTCFLPSLKNTKELQLLILPIDNPEKATLHHDLVQGFYSKISINFTNVFKYIFRFSLTHDEKILLLLADGLCKDHRFSRIFFFLSYG